MTNSLPEFTDYGRLSPSLEALKRQFEGGNVSHSYLLTGAKGIGKLSLALYLTASLYCTSETKPCGKCEECRRVLEGSHPDVIRIVAKDAKAAKAIKLETIREMLGKISLYTFGNSWRVVLIEPMEALSPAAQNALLKSLEEPLPGVVFLLMAHEVSATLGTIASRCARVKLPPWPEDVIRLVLSRQGYTQAQLDMALPVASGNIGHALQLLTGDSEHAEVNELVRQVLTMKGDADALRIVTSQKDSKDSAADFLEVLEKTLHQVLMARTGLMDADALSSLPEIWKKAATEAPAADINHLISMIILTRRRRLSQVNWQSALDGLLQAFLEAYTKWQN